MKPLKAKDVTTVPFTETQAKARRLDMLIADIEAADHYDHAFVYSFCGTPGCACGHFLANQDLRAEFLTRHPDIHWRLDGKRMVVSPLAMKAVAADLGIPWRVFDDPSPYHDGTKSGVLAELRLLRAEMG